MKAKVTFWWFGGLGIGVWRSVYPHGPLWSFAIGPLTVLVGFTSSPGAKTGLDLNSEPPA